MLNTLSSVSVRESRIQYLCDPQWFRDTASRGPTTIVAPESQSRTCPSDHGISGSSRPQPPPDNQSRPSGGTGGSGARDSGSRGGSRSRGDRSGSSKKRYSSSSGGPFRRSFEDWLG
ncbi:hypothetical protein F511_35618 [Dorcoceras hygrometricum]|uniref:Uncharacterized protein n=1 Tax=Dorcoceras hygrometricum TaxID=472368 RepID=A0A2Z7CTS1_9LAMI|nr:hypothetical protein F511_35618 [Dorcoceras hygrometricum]